jgi:hypothetical protein
MLVMTDKPYISFVAVARNDNYGGDFLGRINTFVRNLVGLCDLYKLDSELVIVEWNPPSDRAPLIEAIYWPRPVRYCDVRIVQVPSEMHRRLPNSDKMPVFEYIGKNVGVRRARGEYVLVTNPDLLFSRGLIERLAKMNLKAGRYYRTARYDVKSPVPMELSLDEQLQYCRHNIIKRCSYWYSPQWTFRARFNPYRLARALAGYVKWQIWNRSLVNPYSNAAGDFFLMHASHWKDLRGYPELATHSFIDSYLAYMAHSSGQKLRIIRGRDVFLYHQDHSRKEHASRPLTDLEQFLARIKKMIRQRSPLIFNSENWGLGNEILPEFRLNDCLVRS